MTPYLVSKLRRHVKGPLLCKPNAGIPVIGNDGIVQYNMDIADFADIQRQCLGSGATLLGGCCGTTPEFMAQMIKSL
jgi:5-methyltetrahydrofolate--homocysteine methyltransferase